MRGLVLIAALLIGLAAPACAADDVAAAQGVIRSQVEALGRDDAAAAYSYAAPAIQDMFPQAEIFMSMVQRSYAPVYRHKSFEFGEARVADGKIAQRVHIVDADGVPWEALYTLEQRARRQPQDQRLCPAEGGPGGVRRYAIASRCRARSNSATMMVMLSAFQPSPLTNAAA